MLRGILYLFRFGEYLWRSLPENRLYPSHTILRFVFKERYEINDVLRAREGGGEREKYDVHVHRRVRVIISSLIFPIPPFTHPSTSSFLRESSRGIALWCIPDVFLTLLLTQLPVKDIARFLYNVIVQRVTFVRCLSLNRSIHFRISVQRHFFSFVDVTMPVSWFSVINFFRRSQDNRMPSIWNVTCSSIDLGMVIFALKRLNPAFHFANTSSFLRIFFISRHSPSYKFFFPISGYINRLNYVPADIKLWI